MAGVNPGPVRVYTALKSFMPHAEELNLHSRTSVTLSMNCNQGGTMVRKPAWTMGNRLCTMTKTTRRFSQRAATVGARMSCPQQLLSLSICRATQQGNRSPCQQTGESWSDNSLDRGKPPLRINRAGETLWSNKVWTIGICLCTTPRETSKKTLVD